MNWELITQGLELSVMGILTTFMALGLFIGTILLLRTVFPTEPRRKKVVEEAPVQEIEAAEVVEETAVDVDAVTAAIGAAVYVQSMLAVAPEDGTMLAMEAGFAPQSYRPRRKGLGARLEEPRGRWWQPMGDNEQGQ